MNVQADQNEALIARIVTTVLRELGHGEPAEDAADAPEFMSDPEIRRRFFGGMSRSSYWALSRQPGFPQAFSPHGPRGIKLRKVREIREWLGARATT